MTEVRSARAGPVKRRLHPVGIATTILQSVRQFFVLIVAALVGGGSSEVAGAYIQGSMLVLVVVIGIGQWFRLRYWIEDGSLRVSEGLLLRREVFIEHDKIQAVDVRAGLVQRLFGVVRLQIKTGATGTQVDLRALTRQEAERLQRLLAPGQITEDVPAVSEPSAPRARWTIGPRELVALGATSGNLGVVASFLLWVLSQSQDRVARLLTATLTELAIHPPTGAHTMSALLLGAGFVAFVTLTWGLSILGAAISWGDFSVTRKGDRILVARGLVERREVAVPRGRIQAITVVEELLQQPFGRCAVYVESVGHAEEKGASTCLHPFLKRSELPAFLDALTPGFYVAPPLHRPPPRARSRFLVRPTVLWLSGVAAAAWALGPWPYLGLLGLPLLWWIGLLEHRDTGAGVEGRVLVIRSRWVRRRTAYVPRHRIQVAEWSVNPFQRRKQLASLAVVAASGATGRTYVARDLGEQIPDALLDWLARLGPMPAVGQWSEGGGVGLTTEVP